jgi:hypothetical protein
MQTPIFLTKLSDENIIFISDVGKNMFLLTCFFLLILLLSAVYCMRFFNKNSNKQLLDRDIFIFGGGNKRLRNVTNWYCQCQISQRRS